MATDNRPVDVLAVMRAPQDNPRSGGMGPTNRTVECKANRGKKYRVTFGTSSEPTVVESVYRRWNDTGRCYRQIWTSTSGKPMSAIVACAVRAALAKFGGAA